MTVQDWLVAAQSALSEAGITTARLDALILLEAATGRDRAQLLAYPDYVIPTATLHDVADQLDRRLQHEPLAYILGYSEFYGRRFAVTPDVLVPRPESEALIEVLKDSMGKLQCDPKDTTIADIGSGSGCLAITAALETDAVVCAVDIDEATLMVAKHNAVSHTTPLLTLQGDLLTPFLPASSPDFAPTIVLANLPYVPTEYPINDAARHEPALALFGAEGAAGTDGLELFRALFTQAAQLSTPPLLIITESLPEQHAALATIAASAGYPLATTQGFAQAFTRA